MARQLNYKSIKYAVVPIQNRNDLLPVRLPTKTQYQPQYPVFKYDRITYAKAPPKSKLQHKVDRANIDYLHKFVDIIENEFTDLLERPTLTNKSLQFLQDDVQTMFQIEHYKVLRTMQILPNQDVLVGKKEFATAVAQSITTLKMLHTDCALNIKLVKPKPERHQVEIRYTFTGMTRLPKNPVEIDFIVKFHFSQISKQVHLIEFTDKHLKHDKSFNPLLKTLGVLALSPFGIGLGSEMSLCDDNTIFVIPPEQIPTDL